MTIGVGFWKGAGIPTGERVNTFIECGCCGAYHRTDFHGDCREDSERHWELPGDAEVVYLDDERDDDDGLEMHDDSCGECGHPYKRGDETHYPECSRITSQPRPAKQLTSSEEYKHGKDQAMTKRTVEIEDNLQEIVDSAIEDVKNELLSYLEQNPDTDETPCISNDLDYPGAIHEIVDGAVPVYTNEVNDLFYLYGNEIEEAFDDAGIGDKDDAHWPSGWKAAAIYCYIEQQVHEWYRKNADDVFEEWKEKRIVQTSCQHCELDIEGTIAEGDWRDRGNNTHCPIVKGEEERLHEPVDE